MKKLNDQQLAKLIHHVVTSLQYGSIGTVNIVVSQLREIEGIYPNVHLNKPPEFFEQDNGRTTMEWYAGQILDIVDEKKWFAMNSILNSVERFVPRGYFGNAVVGNGIFSGGI